MEGKLIKVENGYVLMVNNIMYATDNDKLSLKNCQSIKNGYDLDELALIELPVVDDLLEPFQKLRREQWISGFQKAVEILGDKKFSEGDMAYIINIMQIDDVSFDEAIAKFQSLQQTEWDVEIVMECGEVKQCECSSNENCLNPQPKLDEDGCLILKRK